MTCHNVQDGTRLRKDLSSLQGGGGKWGRVYEGDGSSIGGEDEEDLLVDALLF